MFKSVAGGGVGRGLHLGLKGVTHMYKYMYKCNSHGLVNN